MQQTHSLLARSIVCKFAVTLMGVLLMVGGATRAEAAEMILTYTDTFTSAEGLYLASAGSPTLFTANTPFQITAVFDTNNRSFSLPGFNAYTPTLATIRIGGNSYTITDADVSIFDRTNPFNPGLYGVGFIQNPALDQAGFVADFSGASPNFTVNNLVPTTFTGYNGTGFGSGSGIPPGCAATGTCTSYNNTPLHLLSSNGTAYLLSIGNRSSGNTPAATASLATPEPASLSLLLAGIGFLGLRRMQRK